MGGRQAPVYHVASLRQPATRALPAAKQNKMRDKPLSGWTDISTQPVWDRSTLKQQPIAQLVVDSIRYGAQHLQYYDLQGFVVMANHVHLLVRPRVSPSRFLQTLKGYTAREANRLLGRTGQPFWQREYYDQFS